MPVHVMVRAESGVCKPPPFAQLPHDIAADPRLTPVDVRVIAALLFWARDKAAAWPCDRSIGSRVGRSVQTVQRSLRRLQGLGLIDRERVEPSDANRTGRIIRLRWRVTPRSPVSAPPRSSVSDEARSKREKERQPSDSGPESPPPTGGNGEEEGSASAEELELWTSWAQGSNPTLARIGRAALATAGVVEPPCPAPIADLDECRPEGPRDHDPTVSQAPRPTGPQAPRPEGTQAPKPVVSRSQGIASPRAFRTTVSGAPRPVGPRASGATSPRARDAGDLAIPWACVLASLGDRRPGGSRHPRPQGP